MVLYYACRITIHYLWLATTLVTARQLSWQDASETFLRENSTSFKKGIKPFTKQEKAAAGRELIQEVVLDTANSIKPRAIGAHQVIPALASLYLP